MRIAHLMLVSLLAATLVACGDDENPSNDGGSGGTGGDGGTGGTGGVEPIDCGGARVIELESSTNAVLNDRTDSRDNFVASCTPAGVEGNDVVVHFVVPEDGNYRFSTAGSDFDTLIFAMADCNDGFTELKCNDDSGSLQSGMTLLDRHAGEEVFVVVDSVDVRESRPFTLTVTKITAAAPTIGDYAAYYNSGVGSGALRATGQNPDSPVVGFSIQFYGASGDALFAQPFVARFDEVEILTVTQADGAFTVEGSFSLGEGAPAIGAIEFSVFDELDLPSATVKEDTEFPPTVGRGEACDPGQALNVCEGTDVCPQANPVCTAAP